MHKAGASVADEPQAGDAQGARALRGQAVQGGGGGAAAPGAPERRGRRRRGAPGGGGRGPAALGAAAGDVF